MISLSILVLELEQYSLDGWNDRCMRGWMAHQTPRVAAIGAHTAVSFIKSRGLYRSLLGPSLFNIFFKDLEGFIVDTILSGMEMAKN